MSQYQEMPVEEYLCTCGDIKFRKFPYLKIPEQSKTLRESQDNYPINKVKPSFNKKTLKHFRIPVLN